MSADDEILREFLLESGEGLNQLDRDFVELEKNPADRERLGGIFRCIHTIKGASGFLALHHLEAVAHAGESLLSRLRNGDFLLDVAMTSTLLAMVDAIRAILGNLDARGVEGEEAYAPLVAELTALTNRVPAPSPERPPGLLAAMRETPEPPTPQVLPTDAAAEPAPVAAISEAPPRAAPPSPTDGATPMPAAPSPTPTEPATSQRPEPTPEGEASQQRGSVSDSTIRVDVVLLDRVMNLVGELVLARNQILQFGGTVKDASFAKASQRLNLLTTELQEGVMKTRM